MSLLLIFSLILVDAYDDEWTDTGELVEGAKRRLSSSSTECQAYDYTDTDVKGHLQ